MATYMNGSLHRDGYGRPIPHSAPLPSPSSHLPEPPRFPARSPRIEHSETFGSPTVGHERRHPAMYPYPDQRPPHHPPPDPRSFAPGPLPRSQQPLRDDSRPPTEAIKCSSCSASVPLEELGDHACAPQPSRGPAIPEMRGLRIDVQAAGAGARSDGQHGYQAPSRSPMFPGHLEPTPPHTPGTLGSSSRSRPTSPALSSHSDQLSRSVSSNSSASSSLASGAGSSRMPFFERYNKLVGSSGSADGAGTALNMAGVGMRNLDLSVKSPRAGQFQTERQASHDQYQHPQRGRSTSPNPHSLRPAPARSPVAEKPRSPILADSTWHHEGRAVPSAYQPPSPNPVSNTYSVPQQLPTPLSALPQVETTFARPGPERSPSNPPLSPLPSAPLSKSPSVEANGLARSASNSSSLHSAESAYIAYDRRNTLKATLATSHEAGLARSPSVRSQKSQGALSTGSLDALEDLLLMARAEARDDDDGPSDRSEQALHDEFFSSSRTTGSSSRSNHPDDDDDDRDATSTPRAPARMPTSRSVPALGAFSNVHSGPGRPGLSSSESSPNLSRTLAPSSFPRPTCTTCCKELEQSDEQKAGDGQSFCKRCYAERYLPKCRKCKKAIEGGAVTSSDGKVLGKYHPACFSCFSCSKSFPTGDFYVYDGKPYCQYDYHLLNGSLCAHKPCGSPIEGPCVSLVGEENGGGGRYHPQCFTCSIPTCARALLDHHFVVNRLPYCETHSSGPTQSRMDDIHHSVTSLQTSRAKKRQTIITRR
ncbi:LIM domain-containing protein [Sporobolomyces koalae]|uniref:LIM domain-containing protein n=1 Tax=Sporobolomyces koalae TaxID=500713 RepID=UPI00317FA2B6